MGEIDYQLSLIYAEAINNLLKQQFYWLTDITAIECLWINFLELIYCQNGLLFCNYVIIIESLS